MVGRGYLEAGVELGAYRIESVLGRGGMGVVYLATHIRLARKVGLKVLSPELSEDDEFRARFIRESELAASLEHPNILPIYDAGEDQGEIYLAMRYIAGGDLRSRLRERGHLPVEQTISIVRQIALALDLAHSVGLVHRDVKPANVLLDANDHAYLADFGLARRSNSANLTRTGLFLGSVDYCAPEQIEGKPLDGRADIYSLGCLLYHCLTGQPPFTRDSDIGVIKAHLFDPVPPLTDYRADLPESIQQVIAKATAKDPADRYPRAAELAAALAEANAGATVPGPPPSEEPLGADPTGDTTHLRARPERQSIVEIDPTIKRPLHQDPARPQDPILETIQEDDGESEENQSTLDTLASDPRRRARVLVLGIVVAAVAVGLYVLQRGRGGDTAANTKSATTTKAPPTTTSDSGSSRMLVGKQVFLSAGCAACHTLKAAGATSTIGPNLDALKQAQSVVARQVRVGGGVMPAFKGQLTDAQIQAVAAYVSSVAGRSDIVPGGPPTGAHSTNIVSTKANPGGLLLSETALNTVTASTDLSFVVTVHNGADSQEVGILVTLTIQKPGGAIVKTKKIDVVIPGQDWTVSFSDLGGVPFARRTMVNVDVAPVPHEQDATNNKASYPVIFSLG